MTRATALVVLLCLVGVAAALAVPSSTPPAATAAKDKPDTKAPPKPTITNQPAGKTTAYTITYAFTDSEAGVTFECRLDGAGWTACDTPKSYSGLPAGRHEFGVRALDAAGNASAAASHRFEMTAQTGAPFAISGSAPTPLFPGASAAPIPLTLTNPNSVTIHVTSLSVSVSAAGLPAGCSASWFDVAPSNVSSAGPVSVPPSGSVTLPAQGATAPSIRMVESNSNQDACRDAPITLVYSGSAHSS